MDGEATIKPALWGSYGLFVDGVVAYGLFVVGVTYKTTRANTLDMLTRVHSLFQKEPPNRNVVPRFFSSWYEILGSKA